MGLAAVIAVFGFNREREPSYQGKKLSEWLQLYQKTSHEIDTNGYIWPVKNTKTLEAERAVRAIGSNGIPTLLNWIQIHPPTWKDRLNRLQYPDVINPFVRRLLHSSAKYPEAGFQILGPDAKSAIPTLNEFLQETNFQTEGRTICAIRALWYTGPAGITMVVAQYAHDNKYFPNGIKRPLIYVLPEFALGINASQNPSILNTLKNDRDPQVAAAAQEILKELDSRREHEINFDIEQLEKGKPASRAAAARELQYYGALAAAAKPSLEKALQDTDFNVRYWATNTLQKLATGLPTNTPAQ